jgi:hypothetical protein
LPRCKSAIKSQDFCNVNLKTFASTFYVGRKTGGVKIELKKFILLGIILVIGVIGLPYILPVPMPALPIQLKVASTALSTAGAVCQFSALYFDAGANVLYGIVTGGGLVDGVQQGTSWLQNGMSTNQWGPANPYNCPP